MLTNCFKRMDRNEKEEYIRKATTVFFIYSGFWKSKTNHQLNLPVAIFHLIVLLAGFFSTSYMFILKYDDIDVCTETVTHLVQIVHATAHTLILITRKQSLDYLAEVLNMTVDDLNLPVKDRIEQAKILQKERDSCVRVMTCIFTMAAVCYASIIYDTTLRYFTGKPKLLFYTWFPFETDYDHKLLLYFLATLFELMIYADLLLMRSAVWVLWFWTIHLVCGILRIVGSCLKSLDIDENNNKYSDVEDISTFNNMVKQKLIKCVDLHVLGRRLVHELNSSMAIGLFVLILSLECAICLCGFHVVEAARTIDLSRMLRFSSGAVLFIHLLYATCATGQRLIDRSDELYQTLYSCDWPNLCQWAKTSIYICQTVSKKPLIIHDGHVIKANRHTFLLSMKAVYSYLNFLEAMKDKT